MKKQMKIGRISHKFLLETKMEVRSGQIFRDLLKVVLIVKETCEKSDQSSFVFSFTPATLDKLISCLEIDGS
jgi:hypothetical protein